jgi:hypothetical protein
MLNSFFSIMSASTTVKSIFGSSPIRIYQGNKLGTEPDMPYAIFNIISAIPYNCLSDSSDMDVSSIQVDIYSNDQTTLESGYNAIRNAIETKGYVTRYSTDDTELENGKYNITMEIELHDERGTEINS